MTASIRQLRDPDPMLDLGRALGMWVRTLDGDMRGRIAGYHALVMAAEPLGYCALLDGHAGVWAAHRLAPVWGVRA